MLQKGYCAVLCSGAEAVQSESFVNRKLEFFMTGCAQVRRAKRPYANATSVCHVRSEHQGIY